MWCWSYRFWLTSIISGCSKSKINCMFYLQVFLNSCNILLIPAKYIYYAPKFEENDRAYWFRVVRVCMRLCMRPRSSRTVHARVLKFHVWIPHGKIADTYIFLFLSTQSPFLELRPFEKIRMKSDACRMKSDACHIYEPCMLGFWNFIYGFLMEK